MTEDTTVTLPARQLFSLADASTVRIVCTDGCLWLTLDDDPRDVILEAGECFEAHHPRRALLYALRGSAFVVEPRLQGTMRRSAEKNSSDCMRSPAVWAATRAASSG